MQIDQNGFRRFSDKVLYCACSLVLILVGAVWAVTWGSTRADISETKLRVNTITELESRRGERLSTLEASQEENKRRLERIERGQEDSGRKLDAILIQLRK